MNYRTPRPRKIARCHGCGHRAHSHTMTFGCERMVVVPGGRPNNWIQRRLRVMFPVIRNKCRCLLDSSEVASTLGRYGRKKVS